MLGGLVLLNLYVFLWRDHTSIPEVREAAMAERNQLGDDSSSDDGERQPNGKLPEQDEADGEGRWVDGKVEKGDSLGRILRREGFTPPEADRIIRALEPHMDFRKIRVGQEYRIHFDDNGALERFEFHISKVEKVEAVQRSDGELEGKKIDAKTDLEVESIGGTIDSSLYTAIKDAGEDTQLVAILVDLFAFDINFYIDQHDGDQFRLLIEKEYLNGEFLRYRRVVAAEYSGKVGTFRALWWRSPDGKREGYFTEKGEATAKTFLKTPLKFSRISSKFDKNRMHPILDRKLAHLGVDYAASVGTPVWAAASGKLVFRGWKGAGGNTVILDHGNGTQTLYMHLSRFRKGQNVGQSVKQKTVIGYVGTTGRSTGPHLHFSVKQGGKYIDPLKMKMQRGPGVPEQHRGEFDRQAADIMARLSQIPVKRPAGTAAIEAKAQ